MIINKKNQQNNDKNKRKERQKKTISLGLHKRLVIVFWTILISSVLFGVYKNVTAIDVHTIYEKETIELKLVDTSNIQSYVTNFANVYYSWSADKVALEAREEKLQEYLSEELQQLNKEMIRVDVPTTSSVQNIQFWKIEDQGNGIFKVHFSVEQTISEGDNKKRLTTCYQLSLYVDDDGDMVIVQNPTIDKLPEKANYEPTKLESDGSVDATTMESVNEFLETFFTLYPSATQKELAYYVSTKDVKPIQKDYVFVELVNPTYQTMDDNQLQVNVVVKYLDNETKTTHFAQYQLVLEKTDNWKIISTK